MISRGLYRAAEQQMRGPRVYLQRHHAELMWEQFQETAAHRFWNLLAVAIMFNHFHLVVEVPGDPCPKKMLADFKAYGSRKLNRNIGKPLSDSWWTNKGSKLKLVGPSAVKAAIDYVLYKQPNPFVVWSAIEGRLE